MPRRKSQPYRQYKWRLYADHNIEAETVRILRSQHLDVLHVSEHRALVAQREDYRFHVRNADRLRRYILTRDEDFWNDHKVPLAECRGVILIKVAQAEEAAWAVVTLRNMYRLFTRIYRDGFGLYKRKVKLTEERITLRLLDGATGRARTVLSPWPDWR